MFALYLLLFNALTHYLSMFVFWNKKCDIFGDFFAFSFIQVKRFDHFQQSLAEFLPNV